MIKITHIDGKTETILAEADFLPEEVAALGDLKLRDTRPDDESEPTAEERQAALQSMAQECLLDLARLAHNERIRVATNFAMAVVEQQMKSVDAQKRAALEAGRAVKK